MALSNLYAAFLEKLVMVSHERCDAISKVLSSAKIVLSNTVVKEAMSTAARRSVLELREKRRWKNHAFQRLLMDMLPFSFRISEHENCGRTRKLCND